AAAPTGAATLHRNIVLTGKDLKVGDIFDGAGKYGDKIVGRAPEPGQRYTLEPKWLAYVARSYNISWQPLSADDRTIVERASHMVSEEEIRAKILHALKTELPTLDRYSMAFDNKVTKFHLPTDVAPTLAVKRMDHDRISNRFFAVLVAPKDEPGAHRFTISGKLYRMVDIPVVTRRIRKGDIIEKADVQTITMRADKLGPSVLMTVDELIGKSPKRTLIEHRPIRTGDVREPILVKRRSLVTMIYQTRFMRISARGIAKQNGAIGDTIRVENSGSKKIVAGVVTAPGEITITLSQPIAMK
ncbi:MAG: flagellar basal body P-ring formation chaperone FlgA, partial [Proteobacteria bacterium]|nr:flagellar basal body P-ring formation chaperone FlgA [Pseudomonadota bacterium]